MIYILSLTFFILQCLDWYTTRTILKNGGREQNPVMSFVFKYVNIDVAMGIKAILLSIGGYFIGITPLIIQIKEIDFTIPDPLLLVVLIVIYLFVVIHNWKSL